MDQTFTADDFEIIMVNDLGEPWTLQHRWMFTVMSRAVFGLASLALAGQHLFAPDFWRAVTKSHISRIVEKQPNIIIEDGLEI